MAFWKLSRTNELVIARAAGVSAWQFLFPAVLLGALVIHGFQPGPRLFESNPTVVYTIIFACLLANIVMAFIMFGSMKWLARLTQVPRRPS